MTERSNEQLSRRRFQTSTRANSSPPPLGSRAPTDRQALQWPNGYSPALKPSSLAVGAAEQTMDAAGRAAAGLVRTIEGEVIPRLMLALKSAKGTQMAMNPQLSPSLDDVLELAELSLSTDESASQNFVNRQHMRGMLLETIYLQLIAPAARHLGALWVEDALDFTEVTIGLGRLQQIVRNLSPSFRMDGGLRHERANTLDRVEQRRGLIAPMPGEQHTLGVVMIEDFFTRAGWEISGWPSATNQDLVNLVRNSYFDLVGLSVSCETSLPALEQQIAAVRRASRNKSLIVMVGGSVIAADPKRAKSVGADGTGATGREAVAVAEAAVSRLVERA
jgi:MerR family transcriptional regulator, light-induced transcriptional regulator